MSAYQEQLDVMNRIASLETELEKVGDDMDRCTYYSLLPLVLLIVFGQSSRRGSRLHGQAVF